MRSGKRELPRGHHDRMLPVIARAFAELGYRRATTAELARRCDVRENILYRVWPTKKQMFLAAIEYVYVSSVAAWEAMLAENRNGGGRADGHRGAERILEYEAAHHGEAGLYRIVFTGLAEADDPDIRDALRGMYRRFHQFIVDRITEGGGSGAGAETVAAARGGVDWVGWAVIGLGTVSSISRELGLMKEPERRTMFERVGKVLISSDVKSPE